MRVYQKRCVFFENLTLFVGTGILQFSKDRPTKIRSILNVYT